MTEKNFSSQNHLHINLNTSNKKGFQSHFHKPARFLLPVQLRILSIRKLTAKTIDKDLKN